MRRYSRSFQRGAGRGRRPWRWPLVEGREDVEGLRVVLDEVGEVAAGAGHRHDRGGQTRVGVEPLDAVGLVARQPLQRGEATGVPTVRRLFQLGREHAASVVDPARFSGTSWHAGSLITCPGCVSRLPAEHRRGRPRRERAADHRRVGAGRGRLAATSPSPSWPSPATRPRIWCSSPASSPTTSTPSRRSPPHRSVRGDRRLRRRRARPAQRRGRARGDVLGVYRSACCPTTRCSTSSATSRRAATRWSCTW